MTKKQAGGRQIPVQRAIEAGFSSVATGRELHGTLYANDFGRGATEHQLEGYLSDREGHEWLFRGLLQGVEFVSKETRGAPKKTGRNVALYLAAQCMRAAVQTDGVRRFSVLKKLRELWGDLPADDSTLQRNLKLGEKAAGGLPVVLAGVAIVAQWREFEQHEDGGFTVRGTGWRWAPGMDAALHGDVLLRVHVRQAQE